MPKQKKKIIRGWAEYVPEYERIAITQSYGLYTIFPSKEAAEAHNSINNTPWPIIPIEIRLLDNKKK